MKLPKQLLHRMVQSGIYQCGAREADGEKCSMRYKDVTCPKCRAITEAQRAKFRRDPNA
jgi:hypothetical protein